MGVNGQAGVISIAPQATQFGDDVFSAVGQTYHRWRFDSSGLGTDGPVVPLEPEAGGPVVPTGTYKAIHAAGGDIVFKPRLAGTLGWLLHALMGDVTSWAEPGVTGAYRHRFQFAPDGRTIPYISGRKLIPGVTGAEDFGEQFWDGIVRDFRLSVPQRGPLMIQSNLMFCNSGGVDDPSGWTYSGATENSDSMPVSGFGSLLIGGESYPIINAVVEFSNGTTTPQQEQVVGKYEADGFTTLQRVASMRFVYKYNTSALHRQVHYGGPTGTTWSNIPFKVDTDGSVDAFELVVQSPNDMPTATPGTPWEIRVFGGRCTFMPGRVLRLEGATLITQEFTLLFEEPADGELYFAIELLNEQNASYYAWPT